MASASDRAHIPYFSDEEQRQMWEQREKAVEWIGIKARPLAPCPICRSEQWSVSDVYELRPFHNGALMAGGPIFPVFMLICNVCGFTHMFNAIVAGLVGEDGSNPARESNPEPAEPTEEQR